MYLNARTIPEKSFTTGTVGNNNYCTNILFLRYDVFALEVVTNLHLPIKVQLLVRPIISVTGVGNDLISGRTTHRGQFHAMYETSESEAASSM